MAESEFPSNSRKSKETTERPKLERVTESDAQQRKTPVGTRMKNAMWGPSAKGILAFVAGSVVLPALKDLASEGLKALTDGMIYGEDARRTTSSRYSSGGKTPYNRMHKAEPERVMSAKGRANHDFGELVLSTRNEGQLILNTLSDLIEDYGHATVAEMYDLAGITGSFTDSKWGWMDIRGADIRRVAEGYVLKMPKTEPID